MRRLVVPALLAAGCGGHAAPQPELTGVAATPLKDALTDYAPSGVRLRFSDPLGGTPRADVVAVPRGVGRRLYAEGVIEKPRVFASNWLVIAIRPHSTRVLGMGQLTRPGVRIALGPAETAAGRAARRALARLAAPERRGILAHVRSADPRAVARRKAEATFIYDTDVRTAGLSKINLPTAISPPMGWAIAVVKGTAHPLRARAFIRGLRGEAGRAALKRAGFTPR